MSRKDISIIIPCYNANPQYLRKAIESVHSYSGKYSYEIIVVNDGSTEAATLTLLSELENNNVCVLHQENHGPSCARNKGAEHSQSDFLLCLDSDNAIFPEYIDEGIKALQENPDAAVVYSQPEFIGDAKGRGFTTGSFSIEKLLLESYIDMCTVIRKSAWQQTGGLDEALRQFEDWEFWIRLYKAGWQFVYLDKPLFQYRFRADSLITQAADDGYKNMIKYLYSKHADLVYEVLYHLYGTSIIYGNDRKQPLRSFIKYLVKPTG